MGSNEKRTSMAGNDWRMNQRSGCYRLPGVGSFRERRHIKRKRDERGWEWRKLSGKMQYRGLPSLGFEATQ